MTPPIQTPPRSFPFTGMTVFGWLVAAGGGAFLYMERAGESVGTLALGFGLVLLGGTCIDRTPVVAFIQAITGAISAWRKQ